MSQAISSEHTPAPHARNFVARAGQKLWGFLLGHDIFVSHSHEDAKYALRLASLLSEQGLICYLDQLATRPGAEVPEQVLTAARRSTCFVLVATPPALNSRHVAREFQHFLDVPHNPNKPRNVVVVNVEGALAAKPEWLKQTTGLTHEDESHAAVEAGAPSAGVLGRISESCKYSRRTRQVRRFFLALLGAAALLLALAGSASAYMLFDANYQTEVAEVLSIVASKDAEIADGRRAEAEAKTADAIKQSRQAERDATDALDAAGRAEVARKEAQSRAEQARALEAEARANAAAAREQQAAAERLQRQAAAERIAADAEREKDQYPQRGLLLSLKALEATRADEPQAPGALQALRDVLGWSGGRSLNRLLLPPDAGHVYSVGFVPNSRLLYAYTESGFTFLDYTAAAPRLRSARAGKCHDRQLGEALKFSPDGVWMIRKCGKTNELWNLTAADEELRPTDPAKLGLPADLISDGLGRWLLSEGVLEAPPPAALVGEAAVGAGGEAPGWGSPAFHFGARLGDVKRTHFERSKDGRWVALFDVAPAVKIYDMNRASRERLVRTIEGASETDLPETFGDDRWLLTRGPDGGAQLWDLTNLRPNSAPAMLPGVSADTVRELNFSPDGRWLAVRLSFDDTSKERIQLFYLRGGAASPVQTLAEGPRPLPTKIAFSPDSRFLTVSKYQSLRFWWLGVDDARRPQPRQVDLLGQESSIGDLVFTRDGKWLAASTDGGYVLLRDLSEYAPADDDRNSSAAETLRLAEGNIRFHAFAPDNRWLITTAGRVVALWALGQKDGRRQPLILRGHEEDVFSFTYSPDSRMLATWAGGDARLWNLKYPQPSAQPWLLDAPYNGNVFSPNGKWVVTYGDEDFKLWDLRAGDVSSAPVVFSAPKQHGEKQSRMFFSPDGRWLAWSFDNITFRVGDLNSANPSAGLIEFAVARPPEDEITDLTFVLALLDITRGERCAFSPDGRLLAANTGGGVVRVWDLMRGAPQPDHFDLKSAEEDAGDFIFSEDSRWLALVGKRGASLWDLRARGAKPGVDFGPNVVDVKFNPGGGWMYVLSGVFEEMPEATRRPGDGKLAFKNGKATLWRLGDDETPKQIAAEGMQGAAELSLITSAGFSPNGRWLSLNAGGGVQLWDLRSREPPRPVRLVAAASDEVLPGGMFSPDERWLLMNEGKGKLSIWDLQGGKSAPRQHWLEGLKGRPTNVRFSPDSRWLLAASGNLIGSSSEIAVMVWNLRDGVKGSLLKDTMIDWEHGGPFAFSPDSRWLATTTGNRIPTFWDLTRPNPFEQPAAVVGQYISFKGDSFSPDGEWFAGYVRHKGIGRDGLFIWRMKGEGAPGRPVFISSEDAEWSKGEEWPSFGFSPDGRFLFAAKKRLALWRTSPEELMKLARETAGRDLREFEDDPLGWTTAPAPAPEGQPAASPPPAGRKRPEPKQAVK